VAGCNAFAASSPGKLIFFIMYIAAAPDLIRSSRPIAIWLLICCAMIFAMVVLGGVTRLTHSGLSIVEWKPLRGVLPPLSTSQWEETFRQYQQYPEYQKINPGMTLEGFKAIFWLEYLHRLWGRLIGFVFLVPLLYFLIKGRITTALLPRLILIFVLGGLQGVLGWYMVMSGLIDRPDVSQYRLTAHLALALLIYGYIFWVALGVLHPRPHHSDWQGLRRGVRGLTALIFITILSGGFVAGLDAGFAYNTFPLMGGRWIPEGLLSLEPSLRNLFENITTVQFDHRVLAILTLLTTTLLWLWSITRPLPARARLALHSLMAAAVMQVGLGISTLLLIVPVPLAAAHQAGALILFSTALWTLHELRGG
jgi:heme a synthase